MNTQTIILLTTGLILLSLGVTGLYTFFVGMTSEYNIDYNEGDMDWSVFNSSSYQALQNSTQTLEDEFGKTLDPGETGVSYSNFFDTTWNSLKTAISSIYASLKISTGMAQGLTTGALGVVGVEGSWILGGIIAMISITIILIIIGWWMGK